MSATPDVQSIAVLLVDPDLRTSRRLAELLSDDGFRVEVVGDGAAAMDRLSRSPLPGTLITELAVPTTDGETIARFARARDPRMQLVVLTRYPHRLSPKSFAEPMPTVFTKPLDYPQLLALLRANAAVFAPFLAKGGEC